MKIVIDANIPLGKEFFSTIGEVVAIAPREISQNDLLEADALVVRSVKKITKELLAGSKVKFVGTCTAGFDHLDVKGIEELGITWRNAPGCNATAVVEYVLSVFSALELDWRKSVVGIIGCGNVGGRLYRQLIKLGVSCRCYDPFLSKDVIEDLCDLTSVLQSDIICLHTPLTMEGEFPSFHLLNSDNLNCLKPNATIINAGRGPVIDNQALLAFLNQRQDIRCVLDVWETEPSIPMVLAERIDFATPHIAGHSYDGKIRGTEQIYQQVCQYFGITESATLKDLEHDPALPAIEINNESTNNNRYLESAILQSYDIRKDHQQFIAELKNAENSAECFDRFRKNYPKRREFSCYQVNVEGEQFIDEFQSIGFRTKSH